MFFLLIYTKPELCGVVSFTVFKTSYIISYIDYCYSYSYLDREKILSLTQRRVGPNYIGYKGRFQFMADALKLLLKHILIISKTNKLYFILVPALVCMIIYLFWANILWGPNLAICEVEYNVFLMCLISNLCSILLVLAGIALIINMLFYLHLEYLLRSCSWNFINLLLLALALASQSINFYLITQSQSLGHWSIFYLFTNLTNNGCYFFFFFRNF